MFLREKMMKGRGDSANVLFSRRLSRVIATFSSLPASELLTPIVFKGSGAHLVVGSESQQVYCFSAEDPEQMIDARDAEALLKTGLFRVAC